MNIQEAKTEIIRTFRAYMKRKADGTYRIPIEKQRPLLLIGPPGIGKTAVMEQIAKEEQIGLVSYTMTHHTRQSAVGLPLIREKEYGGQVYSATEYTMSEIIASIYDCMAKTGRKQGILFLDEINCVSETLSPVMLQLLQNKMFGTYAIPDGWVIAAAGNPPEYNKSVRELDMATLDRVKHMEIEADLSVWMDYAFAHGVHPSVTAYLTAHTEHFYQIQDTPKGQLFVTARGWEDLSCMMQAYEENGVPVQESLMIQYLQHDEIARSFYLFYDLFRYFGNAMAEQRTSTDQTRPNRKAMTATGSTETTINTKTAVNSSGNPSGLWHMNLAHADITQGLAAASHLMACVRHGALHWKEQAILAKELKEALTSRSDSENSLTLLSQTIESRRTALKIKKEKQLIEKEDFHKEQRLIRMLEDLLQRLKKEGAAAPKENGTTFLEENRSTVLAKDGTNALEKAALQHTQIVDALLRDAERKSAEAQNLLLETISRSYRLLETFPGDEPLLYFTADLTGEPDCAEPLATGGCPEYAYHAQRLLLARQEQELLQSFRTGEEMTQDRQ